MPLPILKIPQEPTGPDLLRYFHRAKLHWTRHLGEETTLDYGVAFTNPELSRVPSANCIFDASLPPGVSAAEAVEGVNAFYASHRCSCRLWTMNAAAEVQRTAPLAEHLLASGYRRVNVEVMRLRRVPQGMGAERADIRIIPARASYRHARELHVEACGPAQEPQLVEAAMLHLDDPHWDSLLAMKEGRALGTVGVLAVGEIGLIAELYVVEDQRRQGIGRTLISRALEICARSLFKHVLLDVEPSNLAALELYRRSGFETVAQADAYALPADRA